VGCRRLLFRPLYYSDVVVPEPIAAVIDRLKSDRQIGKEISTSSSEEWVRCLGIWCFCDLAPRDRDQRNLTDWGFELGKAFEYGLFDRLAA
jgi:hypothetical protein